MKQRRTYLTVKLDDFSRFLENPRIFHRYWSKVVTTGYGMPAQGIELSAHDPNVNRLPKPPIPFLWGQLKNMFWAPYKKCRFFYSRLGFSIGN